MTKEEYAKEIAVAFELRHLQGATFKRMKPEVTKDYDTFIKRYHDTEKSQEIH